MGLISKALALSDIANFAPKTYGEINIASVLKIISVEFEQFARLDRLLHRMISMRLFREMTVNAAGL